MMAQQRFMMRSIGCASTIVATLICAAPVQASLVLSFPDFTGACSGPLTCVGATAVVGTDLRVTPATSGQSGAGYSTSAITLGPGATFSTTFQFEFTAPGGIDPADGITFVLAANPSGLGVGGGGIGYQGVPNSVAIEFDTFNNGGLDISSNHVAIDTNGVLTNTAAVNPYGVGTCVFLSSFLQTGCMSNGHVWTVTIGYDGFDLSVAVQDNGNAAQTVINAFPIDIASILGTTTAFVGFTSGTGAGFENHDILNWRLANDTSLAVPEPGTTALLSAGFLGLWKVRRKRQS